MRYVATRLTRELCIDSIVSVHYFEYTPNFRYDGEAHDFWELIYCDKGRLWIRAGEREFELAAGQAFLHPPEQYHNVRSATDSSANSIIFSFYSKSDALYRISDTVMSADPYTVNALFSVLREAKASFQNPLGRVFDSQLLRKERADSFASEQVIQNYIELILIHMIRKTDTQDRFFELPADTKKHALLDSVVEYMKEHLSEKLTFGFLTSYFSVSPTTMKKIFKTHFGCGAMSYLTSLRIDEAKRLLLDGKISCTAIAERCGFCSVHHFSRVFKENVNMSPTEYVNSVKAMLEEIE